MKKLTKIFALTLVCVLGIVALVACGGGGPNADPDKAKANLEAADYEVELMKDRLSLGVMELMFDLEEGDLEAMLIASNGDDGIAIYYFASASAAKKAWDKMSELGETDIDGMKAKQSGKMIYGGTDAAIAAAK